MEGLRIRRATLSDVRRLAEIERACFEEGYPESLLAFFITHERYVSLVAEVGGVVIGLAVGGLEEREHRRVGHIWTIEVLPAYRNRGIGTSLLKKLEEELAARGATEFCLEVRVDNTPALHLYEKFGYERVGLLKDYYGPGRHGYFMRKGLSLCEPEGSTSLKQP